MISDNLGIQFLQWCLPRMRLRWPGFRKVRRRVYKRLNRRLKELKLSGLDSYRDYLEQHPDEWEPLDALCRISISRFYRDQSVFQNLERDVAPQLARLVLDRGEKKLRCWSAGCGAGEEPYALAIIWRQQLALRYPTVQFRVLATDIDPQAIKRARRGCYPGSCLKELPSQWRTQAFTTLGGALCLRDEYRTPVIFKVQDIRKTMPPGWFHLILCRNLVFTYFDEALQREILQSLVARLMPGGALIVGKLESLPEGRWGLEPWWAGAGIYRKLSFQGFTSCEPDGPETRL